MFAELGFALRFGKIAANATVKRFLIIIYMKVAWFSCGVTSAVACRLALEMYEDVQIYFIETGQHHKDNKRFINDFEKWVGTKVNIIQSAKYKSVFHVIEKTGWINSPWGAECTKKLKKDVRFELEKKLKIDNQIFGFEWDKKEINRAIRFKEQYPYTNPLYPLIERQLDKNECAGIITNAGIQLPEMYKLGYSNNNCIGCVKGGQGYWNQIRKDFPKTFDTMAKKERKIGASCINGIYLDELKPDAGVKSKQVMPDCGLFCQIEFEHILDARVEKIYNSELSIYSV